MTSPAPSISLLLSRIGLLLTSRLSAHLDAESLGGLVEPGMGPVLFALFEGPTDGLRLSSLADGLGIARSTMTAMARRLESRGLARAVPDLSDGRARRLRLTPRGRRLRPRLERIREALDTEIAQALRPRERLAINAILGRVHTRMTSASINPPRSSARAR